MTVITEPGRYEISAAEYHGDPVPTGSLSSSGARRLLPPSCPALFRHEREHGQEHRAEFDIGTAAHKLVLGAGPAITEVKARDWRTKAAQEARDEAYATGAVPLLSVDYDRVTGMAAALTRHDIAMALLNPDHGQPEQAIFWQDEQTGIWRRALIDWLPDLGTGRPIVVDYKTTISAEKDSIRKSVARYGYHQQGPWYLDACASIGYPPDTAFVFIFQEKTAPYLITVVELDDEALTIGGILNFQALSVYRQCVDTDVWPSYSSDIELIQLPRWYAQQFGDVA